MPILIVGLVLFLGVHSLRIFAEGWRTQFIASRGVLTWKALYGAVAIVGFVLIVIGFGAARQHPVILWTPPVAMRHLAALLTLIAFILLLAAYVPHNAIKARLGHPMVLAVKVWALAHLLANGALRDVLLFGAFLIWAILDFRIARRRQPAASMTVNPEPVGTAITVLAGVLLWAVFAFYLHQRLIGVAPFSGMGS